MIHAKLLGIVCYLLTLVDAETIPLKSFYFVRHGKTEWNELGKQQGQTDIPLNETGKEQARKLATLSDTLPITHFCSSTLSRAYETMRILNTNRNLPEYSFDALKEQSKGALEGITEKEWKETDRAIIKAEMEDASIFKQRTKHVLHEILSQLGTPCIISHSNNLRCISKLLGCSVKEIPFDTIWHFEPRLNGTWKVTVLKLPQQSHSPAPTTTSLL